MDECPAVRDVVERVRPLERASVFATAYDVGTQLIKETLSSERVAELIMQHLTVEGLRATRKAVQEGSKVPCTICSFPRCFRLTWMYVRCSSRE